MALPAVEPWLPAERLQREYEAVGFFLSGHPLDDYAAALKRLRVQSWAEFARAVKAGASAGRVAGTVVSRTERRTKNGTKMGIIGLSDASGHYEAVLFAEGLAQYRDLLEPGTAVLLVADRRGAGRRGARPHPVGRAARPGGGEHAEGLARVPARQAYRSKGWRGGSSRSSSAQPATGPDHGDGEVSMVLLLGNGNEVEVSCPAGF